MVGGGGEGITLNLHKITPDIKSCAMFERLFEKKSDLQSIDSFARNKGDGGSFKLPFCKKLFDILYISFTKDWCERTSASSDLQMLRLF